MGYYQAGDRGGWEVGNYYAGGDPGFFSSLWSGIKAIGRVAAPVLSTLAPIVGTIAAPFTGGLSMGLGAAIGAGARLLGGALDDPTPSGSPLENVATAVQPAVSPGYRYPPAVTGVAGSAGIFAMAGGMGPTYGYRGASSAPMRSPPPQFGQDYSDYSYTDSEYEYEEEY